MFSIGDTVMFGIDGVCIIKETTQIDMCGECREYYVLAPVHDQKSTVYVPVDNAELVAKMQPIITRQEIEQLIAEVSTGKSAWISDDSERKDFCEEVIKSGDRKALMQMIEMLYIHREEQKQSKRRFQITDENYLKRAEKMLNAEFAYVLEIEREAVPGFIVEKITALREGESSKD